MAGQAVTYSIYYTHHAGRHFYDGKEKDLVLHFLALWVIYVKELLLALLHTYIYSAKILVELPSMSTKSRKVLGMQLEPGP